MNKYFIYFVLKRIKLAVITILWESATTKLIRWPIVSMQSHKDHHLMGLELINSYLKKRKKKKTSFAAWLHLRPFCYHLIHHKAWVISCDSKSPKGCNMAHQLKFPSLGFWGMSLVHLTCLEVLYTSWPLLAILSIKCYYIKMVHTMLDA